MSQTPDVRHFLDRWPYDPGNNVLLARGADGRQIMLVHLVIEKASHGFRRK